MPPEDYYGSDSSSLKPKRSRDDEDESLYDEDDADTEDE